MITISATRSTAGKGKFVIIPTLIVDKCKTKKLTLTIGWIKFAGELEIRWGVDKRRF